MNIIKTQGKSKDEITKQINAVIAEQKDPFDLLVIVKPYELDYHLEEALHTDADVVFFSDQLKTLQNNAILMEFRKKDKYTIAIDGPSGSGKSTIAKQLAEYLQINYLDTGAMYRALTYVILQRKIDVEDREAIRNILPTIRLKLRENVLYLNDQKLGEEIRTPLITKNVSRIASYDVVREYMVNLQQDIAKDTSIVLDGRDIGTVVLPDSRYKFFLTASAQTRAKRRFDQWKGKEDMTYCEVLKDLLRRDEEDINRVVGPLKCAEDAIVVDSSDTSIEEVVEFMLKKIREKSNVL